jgi:hypothetical protein
LPGYIESALRIDALEGDGGSRIMSGPIVRKYGFPNFEKIFGERPLQHGLDESGQSGEEPAKSAADKSKKQAPAKPKASKPKK